MARAFSLFAFAIKVLVARLGLFFLFGSDTGFAAIIPKPMEARTRSASAPFRIFGTVPGGGSFGSYDDMRGYTSAVFAPINVCGGGNGK